MGREFILNAFNEDGAEYCIKSNMQEVVRCKDCKYFLYDKLYMVEGLPLMGNLVCEKWGNGCRTDENGFCFMGERKEDGLLVTDKD